MSPELFPFGTYGARRFHISRRDRRLTVVFPSYYILSIGLRIPADHLFLNPVVLTRPSVRKIESLFKRQNRIGKWNEKRERKEHS